MKKVAPSERFRSELDEALAGVGEEQDPIEVIGRLGARLILQQALEDEVTELLGRGRYERMGEPVSHRNGYEPRKVATTSGTVELERPRVRDASKLGFESKVLGKGVTRTYALESLVIGSFLRGLSTRDVEAVLEETFDEPVASRSTVSRICEDIRERYRRWCARRLDGHDVVYCFLDAIYLKLHPDDTPAEGVLVAWGVTLEGRKVLLGLQLGSRESYDSWLAFGRDLVARGLNAPALVVADGAPGIWKAVRELWPQADEQRCTVHALRNVTGKLPERHHRELKTRWWQVFDEANSPAEARRGLEAIIADYRGAYPSAMAVIERDLDALIAHLRWPSEHRKRIRTTNLLERTFVEVRRRTKVIGRFPGETSALSLIWAVLEPSSRGGESMNKSELVQAMAKDSGLSKADTGRALESFVSTVQKTLKKGDEVAVTGFGKFHVAKRGARPGTNPATGQKIKIKASKAPKFSAGATLKQAVNGTRKK